MYHKNNEALGTEWCSVLSDLILLLTHVSCLALCSHPGSMTSGVLLQTLVPGRPRCPTRTSSAWSSVSRPSAWTSSASTCPPTSRKTQRPTLSLRHALGTPARLSMTRLNRGGPHSHPLSTEGEMQRGGRGGRCLMVMLAVESAVKSRREYEEGVWIREGCCVEYVCVCVSVCVCVCAWLRWC